MSLDPLALYWNQHLQMATHIYVGHSLKHASNVPIIYNPATGLVSHAFHVTFDNQFTSVLNASRETGKLQEKTHLELIKSLVHANLWHHTDAFSATEKVSPEMVDTIR
jgi:hypothetical protein